MKMKERENDKGREIDEHDERRARDIKPERIRAKDRREESKGVREIERSEKMRTVSLPGRERERERKNNQQRSESKQMARKRNQTRGHNLCGVCALEKSCINDFCQTHTKEGTMKNEQDDVSYWRGNV